MVEYRRIHPSSQQKRWRMDEYGCEIISKKISSARFSLLYWWSECSRVCVVLINLLAMPSGNQEVNEEWGSGRGPEEGGRRYSKVDTLSRLSTFWSSCRLAMLIKCVFGSITSWSCLSIQNRWFDLLSFNYICLVDGTRINKRWAEEPILWLLWRLRIFQECCCTYRAFGVAY